MRCLCIVIMPTFWISLSGITVGWRANPCLGAERSVAVSRTERGREREEEVDAFERVNGSVVS